MGLQAYAGHLSHVEDLETRTAEARSAADLIQQALAAVKEAGLRAAVVSGGSTGTIFIDPGLDALDEMQCGSYGFMDVEYDIVDLDGRSSTPFEPALFVRTSVISKKCSRYRDC